MVVRISVMWGGVELWIRVRVSMLTLNHINVGSENVWWYNFAGHFVAINVKSSKEYYFRT